MLADSHRCHEKHRADGANVKDCLFLLAISDLLPVSEWVSDGLGPLGQTNSSYGDNKRRPINLPNKNLTQELPRCRKKKKCAVQDRNTRAYLFLMIFIYLPDNIFFFFFFLFFYYFLCLQRGH